MPDIQSFTTSGANTWTLPSGWTTAYVRVMVQGAGGGAGSGGTEINGTRSSGGGGGGAGEIKWWEGIVSANQTVTIGAKGTGGAGQGSATSVGNIGNTGGSTSFASLAVAVGGNPGKGGLRTSGAIANGAAFASTIASHGPAAQYISTSMAGGATTVTVDIETINSQVFGTSGNVGYGAYAIVTTEDATATGVGDVDIVYSFGVTSNRQQITFTRGTSTGTINISATIIDPTPFTGSFGISGPGGGSVFNSIFAGNGGYTLPGLAAKSTGGAASANKSGGGGGGSSMFGSGGNGSAAVENAVSTAGSNAASTAYGAGGGGSGGGTTSGAGGNGTDGYCQVFAWKAS